LKGSNVSKNKNIGKKGTEMAKYMSVHANYY